MVTLLTSSKLVTPSFTFCRPDTTQIPNAVLGRLIVDIHGAAAFHDDAADGFGDRHDLVDAHAALVAVRALAAADRPDTL